MVAVEIYDCTDTADEAAAVRVLREIKGLDDHHASRPFGLLYWHKRPFTVDFATAEEAGSFLERLGEFGYRGRLVTPPPD